MESTILNIIINVISSEIFDCKPKLVQKIKLSIFKKKLYVFINKFFEKNDGTIITTGKIEYFLQYYNVIQHALDIALNIDGKNWGEKEYIENLLFKFKNSDNKPEINLNPNDESVLKEFFCGIYKQIDNYIASSLSVEAKHIISKQRSEIRKLTEEIRLGKKEIIDLINQKDQISNADIAFNIFEVLKKKIFTGELEVVNNLLPLLKGKNEDINNGVEIILSSFSDYDLVGNKIEQLSKIKNLKIRIEVEKILILEFFNDFNKLDELKKKCKTEHLCQIIDSIKNNKKDDFYKLEITKKEHIVYYNYTITDKFYSELWLIKRITLKFIEKENSAGIENIIETLLSDDKTFIDELLILEKEQIVTLIKSQRRDETMLSQMKELRDFLNNNKNKYVHSQKHVQIKFYELLTCSEVLIGESDLDLMFEELPDFTKNNFKIQAYKYLYEINRKKVDEDLLIDFCLRSGEYWLLNNYFIKYDCSPESIINILSANISFLKNDFLLFLIYVESVRLHRSAEDSKKIMDEYKEKYDKYLDFWLQLYCSENSSDAANSLKTIIDKWNNDEIASYLPSTTLKFAEILIKNRYYDIANSLINTYDTMFKPNAISIRIRGEILFFHGKEIAARELFINNFSYYERDARVIEMIIVISMNHLKEIPDKVIESAINIGTGKLLMLCALIYNSKKEYSKAKILIMKALIKSPDSSDFCDCYLKMHLDNPTTNSPTKELVEEDSAVYLFNKTKRIDCVYCIYSNHLLPSSPYEWEKTVHIYRDEAIKLGLLGKKRSDTVIIDEIEYEVSDILSLDCYFFRLCLNKMTETGYIKTFSIKTDGDKLTNLEEFKKWIVDNNENDNTFEQLINNYNDLSCFPMPMHIIQSSTRLNYSELILAFIKDKHIIYREILSPQVKQTEGYILSYSSLFVLYKLGIDTSVLIDNHVFISHSTLEMVTNDTDSIIKTNQKEHATTIGVVKNDLFIQESTSDEKQCKMKEAVNIKEYVEKLSCIDNIVDLTIKWSDNVKIKDVLGICDYDAISIAASKKFTLVTAEAHLTAMSQNEELMINTIGIIDFLCEINIPILELLGIMKKMVEYRFMITLTEHSFFHLLKQYSNSDPKTQDEIINAWKLYLNTAYTFDNKYKEIFKQCVSTVYAIEYIAPK